MCSNNKNIKLYIDSTVLSHDVLLMGPRPQFTFNKVGGLSPMEVGALYIFFNRIMSKTQLMHGNIPWRGARDKYPESLQFLIKALTKPGDVVFYVYTFIGYTYIFLFFVFKFHN